MDMGSCRPWKSRDSMQFLDLNKTDLNKNLAFPTPVL